MPLVPLAQAFAERGDDVAEPAYADAAQRLAAEIDEMLTPAEAAAILG